MTDQACPFKVGDRVIYNPSQRGYDLDANSVRLRRGQTYTVIEIQKDKYVLVEGYDHPGGGFYWTEFSPARFDSDVSA